MKTAKEFVENMSIDGVKFVELVKTDKKFEMVFEKTLQIVTTRDNSWRLAVSDLKSRLRTDIEFDDDPIEMEIMKLIDEVFGEVQK